PVEVGDIAHQGSPRRWPPPASRRPCLQSQVPAVARAKQQRSSGLGVFGAACGPSDGSASVRSTPVTLTLLAVIGTRAPVRLVDGSKRNTLGSAGAMRLI